LMHMAHGAAYTEKSVSNIEVTISIGCARKLLNTSFHEIRSSMHNQGVIRARWLFAPG
jgi:hypothetical protein